MSYNYQSILQNAGSISSDFSSIFVLPAAYTHLSNLVNNNVHLLKGDFRISKKAKGVIVQQGISWSSLYLKTHTSNFLQDKNATQLIYYISNSINANNYHITSLEAFYKRDIRLLMKTPFSVDAAVGVKTAFINNTTQVTRHIVTPTVNIAIENKHRYSNFDGMLTLSYKQNQLSSFNLNEEIFYPKQTNTYVKATNTNIPRRILDASYSWTWSGKKNLTSSFLVLSYLGNLTSTLSLPNYRGFVLFNRDSIVQLPTNVYTCSYHYTIPSVVLNALINIDAGYTYKTAFLAQGIDIIKTQPTSYRFYWINASIKRNWKKKYYIKLENAISGFNFKITNLLGDTRPTNTFNLLVKISQRLVISKAMHLASNISFYNNNIFSNNQAAFTYIDLEWNYSWKESPFHLIVRAENLSNQTRYFNSNNSLVMQSFYSIPLIPRNIFTTLRVTF